MTFDPLAAGWKQRHGQGPFTQLVGPIFARREADGTSAYGLLAEERHTNSRGVVHGGMLMTFADHMLGWLVWDLVDSKTCAQVALKSQFTAAVKPGAWAQMRGHVGMGRVQGRARGVQ